MSGKYKRRADMTPEELERVRAYDRDWKRAETAAMSEADREARRARERERNRRGDMTPEELERARAQSREAQARWKDTWTPEQQDAYRDQHRVYENNRLASMTPEQRSGLTRRKLANKPHYARWQGIKNRCYNPKVPSYLTYGARGIRMHEPWRTDYWAFHDWLEDNLGPCPPGWSLDRIDNDGDYVPGNLRWADALTQHRNRRPIRKNSDCTCGPCPVHGEAA